MANLFDYIEKYGEQKIEEPAKLTIFDEMAFARYVYLPLNKLGVKEDAASVDGLSMKEIGRQLLEYVKTEKARFFNDDKKLMMVMAKTARYQDLVISDYIHKLDKKIDMQFAALCIHLNAKEMVVSYMGTDDSLSGWKEDFNMSFMDEVPSQKQAKKYLEMVAKKYPEKRIRIVGHSKGGNLAMAAATVASAKVAERVDAVTSFDGPGFSEKMLKKQKESRLFSKMINYIPEHSMAGRLFLHAENYKVIKSAKEKPYYQHNLYYWLVDLKKQELVPATLSQKSRQTERIIKRWVEGVPEGKKRDFVNAMFKVIELSNYDNPADISYSGGAALPNIFTSFCKLSKSEKKSVFRGMKKLAKATILEKRRGAKK